MRDALECVGEEAVDGDAGVDASVAEDLTDDGGDDGTGEGGGVGVAAQPTGRRLRLKDPTGRVDPT